MSSKLMSGEVCNSPKKHRFLRVLVIVALVVVAGFIIYTIVTDLIKIQQDTELYNELVEQTNAVREENAKISGYLENDKNLEAYIEDMAREKLDYANPDERIYYVVPSAD